MICKKSFLEDIANTQGSLRKWHLLISQDSNSKAPPATDLKLPVWLANTLSYDMSEP